MPTTLEDRIRQAVEQGLQGLTLFRTFDGQWQGARSLDGRAYSTHICGDPVEALTVVLGGSAKPACDEPSPDIFA